MCLQVPQTYWFFYIQIPDKLSTKGEAHQFKASGNKLKHPTSPAFNTFTLKALACIVWDKYLKFIKHLLDYLD